MFGLGRSLKWFTITVAVIAFLLLLINLFDETLLPEAVAFGDFSREDQAPSEDNAYYALVGFYAPSDADAHQRGTEIVKTINARLESSEAISMEELQIDTLLGPDRVGFEGSAAELCPRDIMNCLAVYREKHKEIEQLATRNEVLIARYYALHRFPYFRETIQDTVVSVFPNYANDSYWTVLAKTGLRAALGQSGEALIALEQDTAFWRRVLQHSRYLISKMVAVQRISRNVRLMSEIIASQRLDATAHAAAEKLLAPLTRDERDFTDAVRTEYAITADLLNNVLKKRYYDNPDEEGQPWGTVLLGRLFFQPNATINMMYRQYRELADLVTLPAQAFVPRLRHLQAQEEERLSAPYRWDYLYNPVGKLLFAIGAPSAVIHGRSMGDAHNLDGLMRLVAAQLGIKQQRIADHAVVGFLEKLDDSYRDPYTGAPLRWDPEKRALYFEGMSPRGTGDALFGERIEVYL